MRPPALRWECLARVPLTAPAAELGRDGWRRDRRVQTRVLRFDDVIPSADQTSRRTEIDHTASGQFDAVPVTFSSGATRTATVGSFVPPSGEMTVGSTTSTGT